MPEERLTPDELAYLCFGAGPDGAVQLSSLSALLLNRWAFWQYLHTMGGAAVTGAFAVAGLGAYYHLRAKPGADDRTSTALLRIGVVVAAMMLRNARSWRSTTASVFPASRSASVSPTQTIGMRPTRSALAVFSATNSSVSAKCCRRSLWPRMTQVHPASFTIIPLTSPV